MASIRNRIGDLIAAVSGNALSLEQIAYRLADQIAELEKDRERLDWLATCDIEPLADGWGFYIGSAATKQEAFVADTFRQAIDAARSGDGGGG